MTFKGIVIINSIYKITSKIVSKFSTHISQPQNEFQVLWLNVSATLADIHIFLLQLLLLPIQGLNSMHKITFWNYFNAELHMLYFYGQLRGF